MRAPRFLVLTGFCLALSAAGPAVAQHGDGPNAPEPVETAESAPAGAAGQERGGSGHPGAHWWDFFIIQGLGFGLLLLVLGRFAWPAVRTGLDGRSDRIRRAFDDAERDEREVRRLTTEHRDRLKGFAVEAGRRRDAALREAAALRARLEADARQQAQAFREKSAREAEMESARARAEIRQAVVERAFAEAERRLRAAADDRFQDALVGRYVGDLQGLPPLL